MPALKDTILERIQQRRVRMRSIWYFRLRRAGLLILGVGLLVLLSYIGSFMHFVWHATGAGLLIQFGWTGLFTLLSGLPWLLIVAILIVFVAAIQFAIQFTPSYRRPVVWIALVIIMVTIVGSAGLRHVPFHERWHRAAEIHNWPLLKTLYHYHHTNVQRNFTIGTIAELTTNEITVVFGGDRTLRVQMNSATQFPGGRDFTVGQRIGILGPRTESSLPALGIVTISNPDVGLWYTDLPETMK